MHRFLCTDPWGFEQHFLSQFPRQSAPIHEPVHVHSALHQPAPSQHWWLRSGRRHGGWQGHQICCHNAIGSEVAKVWYSWNRRGTHGHSLEGEGGQEQVGRTLSRCGALSAVAVPGCLRLAAIQCKQMRRNLTAVIAVYKIPL